MAYKSRTVARAKAAVAEKAAFEWSMTIPDDLLLWAREPQQYERWVAPYGHDVDRLLHLTQPLSVSDTERLLSRLSGITREAARAGRGDLLLGFDTRTAEMLGLHYYANTPRGRMHVGPDPSTQSVEHPVSPPWTYGEVAIVSEAVKTCATDESDARRAVDLAWAAKDMLLDVFPDARLTSMDPAVPQRTCAACGGMSTGVMLLSEDGSEYHSRCWSDLVMTRTRR
jgi:hypothetical protein